MTIQKVPLNNPIPITLQYNQANLSDEAGAIFIECETEGSQLILGSFLSYADPDYVLTDADSNTVSLPGQSGMNETGVAWNKADALMALKVNGTWSADVPYGGVLGDGVLDLFRDHLHKGAAHNLSITPIVTYDEAKTLINNKEVI